MGAKRMAHGMIAYVPLSLLREDVEVRVVMESGHEHTAKLKLEKIR